jgi:hypothetical protein
VITKCAKAAEAPDPMYPAWRVHELIAEFSAEVAFTAKPKAENTAHQWLARANLGPDDPHSADTVAQALMRDLVDTGLYGLALCLFGGDIPEGGMEPLTIVISFDVGEQ